jgi:hypothetical protein
MIKYLIVGLFAVSFGCSSDKSKYWEIIGNEYQDINEFEEFNDLKDVGGALVQGGDHSGYTINHCQRNDLHVLILERVKNLPDGKTRYTAIDIFEVNGVGQGNRFEFVTCRLNGKVDSRIFAICEYEDTEFLTKIVKAWNVNIEKGKIEEMAVTGVDCVNISYGGD